jgi:energy-coupling factor transporter ATP-binding protein EcfA2
VSDYPAAVEALVNKKVDLVWFGGFTHVQAQIRSGGKIVPIAQREEDTKFQSVFIAKTDSGIKTLADMKGKQISFGSQSSTSGHLMPRSNLLHAGINPEKDFRRIAYSGAHDATIASVVSGKVDAAALDITVWRKFVGENKVDTKAVDVFFTTPPFFNYNWSVHADMPAACARSMTEGAARPRPGHARGQGDPAAQPRHALHPDQARELQGPGGRRPQRRADLIGRAPHPDPQLQGWPPATRRRARRPPALQGLTCSWHRGEQLAVIGPSGAGKTTLLQVLACALPPTAGGCSSTAGPLGAAARASCSACAAGCSWRRRCRRCRRGSAWSPRCWPAGCRRWACWPACARCSTRRHPGRARGAGALRPGREAVRARRPPVGRRAPARGPGARAAGAGQAVAGRRAAVGAGPFASPQAMRTLVDAGARTRRHAGGHAAPGGHGAGALSRASSACATARLAFDLPAAEVTPERLARLYAQHEHELLAMRRRSTPSRPRSRAGGHALPLSMASPPRLP